ncbi:MAG: FadR/GntR family transcriptional regulator [Pseudorhodoplanes sp.]
MLWGLRPVEQQAAYGLVVERMRRQIHLGLMLPGKRLAAERKLAEDMNIARVTLREALRVLETEGYIIVRRGAYGGRYIADERELDKIARRRAARDPGGSMRVLEFREAAERSAVRFAALRRTPADLKRMRIGLDAVAKAATLGELRQAETTFHLALAEASHNDFLARALEEALCNLFTPFGNEEVAEVRPLRHATRLMLLKAIEARDADRAETLMGPILADERQRLGRVAKVA